MKLSEMLDYTASEFLDDRADLVEGDNDNLWSDSFLVRQFNRAQQILCRKAWVIIQTGVVPAGIVTLATDKATYTLHPSILRVFDATPTSIQDYPLGRTDDAAIRNNSSTELDAFARGEAASLAGITTTTSGAPLVIATDAGSRTLRVDPAPSSDYNGVNLTLKIARMPITLLTLDSTDGEPEVPGEWHLDICEFAAGKALTLPNVDSDQKAEGRRLLDAFDETVRQARRERLRAEMGSNRWAFSSTTATL